MLKDQAILILSCYKDRLTSSCSNQLDGDIEAFDMAINALKDENHAYWIFTDHDYCEGLAANYKCSHCKIEYMTHYIKDHKFCHNCGSIVDYVLQGDKIDKLN